MSKGQDKQKNKDQLLSELDDARQRIAELEKQEFQCQFEEGELIRLNRALKSLSECGKALVRADDEDGLLNEICRTIVETGGYCQAWVGYAEAGEEGAIRPVAWAGYSDEYFKNLEASDPAIEHDRVMTGKAMHTGKPTIARNVPLDPKSVFCCDEAARKGYVSIIALPLLENGRAFGALNLRAVDPETYDAEEVDLLTRLTDDLVFGIAALRERSALQQAQEELRQSFEKLQKTTKNTIFAMAKMTEIRDPYTSGHQQRVAELSCAIAREMGFSQERIDWLQLAASVHDIGKIHVPSEILAMPGRISDIEFELIKTHPQSGFDILKTVEFPWPIAEIVLHHHEKIDGSGYPDGIAGDAIMMESRIICVADVVEAMSSHRPYRATLGLEAALEEIALNRGICYDPQVVDACLRLFAEDKFRFT